MSSSVNRRIVHRWPFRPPLEFIRCKQFFAAREWRGLHFGVFDSFEDARRFCLRFGTTPHYDLDHRWWLSMQEAVHLHDYPVLYWLNRVLHPGSKVADLGGSVGVSYYAFAKLLPLHAQIEWLVCELPEVATQGSALARERGADALSFTQSFQDFEGHDVLFTAGALQFIEPPLSDLLRSLQQPPQWVLINRIPVHDSMRFVTLQNTGTAISPCHVFQKSELEQQLQVLGYERWDEWTCPNRSISIPLHPQHYVSEFKGYCFGRRLDA